MDRSNVRKGGVLFRLGSTESKGSAAGPFLCSIDPLTPSESLLLLVVCDSAPLLHPESNRSIPYNGLTYFPTPTLTCNRTVQSKGGAAGSIDQHRRRQPATHARWCLACSVSLSIWALFICLGRFGQCGWIERGPRQVTMSSSSDAAEAGAGDSSSNDGGRKGGGIVGRAKLLLRSFSSEETASAAGGSGREEGAAAVAHRMSMTVPAPKAGRHGSVPPAFVSVSAGTSSSNGSSRGRGRERGGRGEEERDEDDENPFSGPIKVGCA